MKYNNAEEYSANLEEIKKVTDSLNGRKTDIFSVMTPLNYDWINEDVDIAMRAAGITSPIKEAYDGYAKFWILHYYYFSADVYNRHNFLPALTARLVNDNKKKSFSRIMTMFAGMNDMCKAEITNEQIKQQALGLYNACFD